MPADRLRIFFDTNVLLYLASSDVAKARRLDPYLSQGGMISVQVLNEFTNVARRKQGLEIGQIRLFLSALRDVLDVIPLTIAIHETGLALIERYGLSTYHAMIAAAALQSECGILLSEDMHDGLVIEGKLRIENPFK
jgi:predicted nucleic acid-binding protein